MQAAVVYVIPWMLMILLQAKMCALHHSFFELFDSALVSFCTC